MGIWPGGGGQDNPQVVLNGTTEAGLNKSGIGLGSQNAIM